jgi:ATP-dependent RNA helicase DeaD
MNSFHALGLSQPLVKAIVALGFEKPTPIQSLVIPQLLSEKTDLIALAHTGTGKTAAFGLPLLEHIDMALPRPQALILSPTRELALQIAGELHRFAANLPQLRMVTVYGGADMTRQIRELKAGAQVIIATPGRLKDLMGRGKVKTEDVRLIVLDEADEMLNMGFRPDLEDILQAMPEERQTWLFSATMSREVQHIAGKYLRDPLEISAGERNIANVDIEHQYVLVQRSEKYEALRRLLDYDPGFYGLLFCRTRNEAKEMAKQLNRDGYGADALHGDLSQAQRELVMERFRARQIRVLAATDVAARGIDVSDLTHVIHFNIPEDLSFYTHRSGRTGRAGKAGLSIILLTKSQLPQIRQIERLSRVKFEQLAVPSGETILRRKLEDSLDAIARVEVREDIQPLLPELYQRLSYLSKEELVARLASQSFNLLADRYRNAPDLNGKPKHDKTPFKGQRLFINIGRADGLDKGRFLRLLCDHAGIPGSAIGSIELGEIHSFFEADMTAVQKITTAFRDAFLEGRPLRVNLADNASKKFGLKKSPKPTKRKNGARSLDRASA